jgi:ABC-type Zn uptake system ZnuABC Zn-binding protein ZnuA
MKLITELFEEITPKTILDIIHNLKNVIGIWWYDSKTNELAYYKSSEVTGHSDAKFNDFIKNSSGKRYLEKGRLFNYGNKTVLLVYTGVSAKTSLTEEQLKDVISQIEEKTSKMVLYAINNRCENILEENLVEKLLEYFKQP